MGTEWCHFWDAEKSWKYLDSSHGERATQLRDMGKDLLALLHDLREGTDTSLSVEKRKAKQWEIFVPHRWISPVLDKKFLDLTQKMEKVFVNCLTTYVPERQTGVMTSLGKSHLIPFHSSSSLFCDPFYICFYTCSSETHGVINIIIDNFI